MGLACKSLLLLVALAIAGSALGTIIELPVNYSRTAPWTELAGLGLENLKETECQRTCVSGEAPRVCLFTFILEHYAAMGTACGNCSRGVLADCFRSQCIPADGYERGVMSVNRKIPGPQLHVCKDDLMVVVVANRMTGTGSTLHWHGIQQKNTPSMDGVPRISQCPIGSGEVFTYVFPVEQSGTHFYHSHTGEQKMNGHYGALIVQEPRSEEPWSQDVYEFDLPEHTMVLSDWMHDYAEMFWPGLPTRAPGIRPSSFLINGLGRYLSNPDQGASFDLSSVPLAKFHVESDKSYRFRVINAATMHCPMQIQIEDHNMTVIALDGNYPIKPVIVDAVVTYSGERFDLVINTHSKKALKKNAFWIHIRGLGDCEYEYKLDQYGVLSYGTNVSNFGIIPEGDRPTVKKPLPITTILNHPNTTCGASPRRLCITDLEPAITEEKDEVLTAVPDVRLFVSFGFYSFGSVDDFHKAGSYQRFENPSGNQIISSVMNNLSFAFLPTPTIFMRDRDPGFCNPNKLPSTCKSNDNSTTPYCACMYAETVKENDIVELTLIDSGTRIGSKNHAFHLHGYTFYVTQIEQDLTRNSDYTVEEVRGILDQNRTSTGAAPPLKDTVSVPSKGFVTIRFRASNPGDWLLHCHYDWHAISGMVVLLRVEGELPALPPGFPRCGNFNPILSTRNTT